jgi:hypothetical protein
MATAGCSKTNLGRVKAGIKVVIFRKMNRWLIVVRGKSVYVRSIGI